MKNKIDELHESTHTQQQTLNNYLQCLFEVLAFI